MTEFDLIMAMLMGMGTCLIAALGALWLARKDNVRHPPAGE